MSNDNYKFMNLDFEIWNLESDPLFLECENKDAIEEFFKVNPCFINRNISVVIPGGVTKIGHKAFNGCSYLETITIPDSVKYIGDHSFDGCSSLKSINIPGGVTEIGSFAFYDCSSLKSINIPESVTKIEKGAFRGCSFLESITIPNSVNKIGHEAFSDCSSLKSINIPGGVTEIGSHAFLRCSSLTSITIPNGVTEIGNCAFDGCSSLTSINIPDGVTEIGSWAFSGCSSLKSINIPESVTKIEEGAFLHCSSLISVTIPYGVTEIGGFAFYGCSSLTSINIPGGVTEIRNYSFSGCLSLELVVIPDNPEFHKIDGEFDEEKFRFESNLGRSFKLIKKSEYYSYVGGKDKFDSLSECEKQILNRMTALYLDDNLPENSRNKFSPDVRSDLTGFIDGIINVDDSHAKEFMFQWFKDNIDLAPDCYKHQVIDKMSTCFTYKFKDEDNSILEVASIGVEELKINVSSFIDPYDFITEVKKKLVEELGCDITFIKLFDFEEQDKKDFLVSFLSKFQNQSIFFRGSSNKQIIFDGKTYSGLPTGVASALNNTLIKDISTIPLSELKQTLAYNIKSYVNNENYFSRNLSFFRGRSDDTKKLYDNSLDVINSI